MHQDMEYNGTNASMLGIYMLERPTIPAAKKRRKEIKIPGRDGCLYEEGEDFEPTEIKISFNYIGEEDRWAEKWRFAQKWLSQNNEKLRFSDDPGYFFKIDHVEVEENTRPSARIGVFTANFVTKDGLYYLDEGTIEHEINEVTLNPYEVSHPIYKIFGEGKCILTVNGNEVEANVGQNLVIDTGRMVAYREDGRFLNTKIKGKYKDLYLLKGENQINISDGFTVKIIPNWRCR